MENATEQLPSFETDATTARAASMLGNQTPYLAMKQQTAGNSRSIQSGRCKDGTSRNSMALSRIPSCKQQLDLSDFKNVRRASVGVFPRRALPSVCWNP